MAGSEVTLPFPCFHGTHFYRIIVLDYNTHNLSSLDILSVLNLSSSSLLLWLLLLLELISFPSLLHLKLFVLLAVPFLFLLLLHLLLSPFFLSSISDKSTWLRLSLCSPAPNHYHPICWMDLLLHPGQCLLHIFFSLIALY